MKKAFHILRQLTILLFAVLWFQVAVEVEFGHYDTCGHCDPVSAVSSCLCHAACINEHAELFIPIEYHGGIKIPSFDQIDSGLLMPHDIFRPPLQINI